MTLIDVLMQYSRFALRSWQDARRAALLELTPDQLEVEAKEFCGGRPWVEWLEAEAVKAWLARDALRTP